MKKWFSTVENNNIEEILSKGVKDYAWYSPISIVSNEFKNETLPVNNLNESICKEWIRRLLPNGDLDISLRNYDPVKLVLLKKFPLSHSGNVIGKSHVCDDPSFLFKMFAHMTSQRAFQQNSFVNENCSQNGQNITWSAYFEDHTFEKILWKKAWMLCVRSESDYDISCDIHRLDPRIWFAPCHNLSLSHEIPGAIGGIGVSLIDNEAHPIIHEILDFETKNIERNNVKSYLNVSGRGLLKCAALPINEKLLAVTDIDESKTKFVSSIDNSSGLIELKLSSLEPATTYNIYCKSETNKGVSTDLAQTASVLKTVTTECCKNYSYGLRIKKIPL